MKTIQQRFFHLHGKIKSFDFFRSLFLGTQRLQDIIKQVNWNQARLVIDEGSEKVLKLTQSVKMLGVTAKMDEYEKRKLTIFNLLNFFQFLSVFIVPVAGLFDSRLAPASNVEIILPAFISVLVLLLNANSHYTAARISYFMLYPVVTSFIYLGGVNLGVELYFILYGVLSVFFL